MVTDVLMDKEDLQTSLILHMVNLPLFPPFHPSLPTFVTSLNHLNECMKLDTFPIAKLMPSLSSRVLTDTMLKLYPSKDFQVGRHIVQVQKEKVVEREKATTWSCRVIVKRRRDNAGGGGGAAAASESSSVGVKLPKKIMKILPLLLSLKKLTSLSLLDEDDIDLLQVRVSSVFYLHGYLPLHDTEAAKIDRSKFIHIPTRPAKDEEGDDEEGDDEDYEPPQPTKRIDTTDSLLLDGLPDFVIESYYTDKYEPKGIKFFRDAYKQNEYCRSIAPGLSSCTSSIVSNNPRCTQRCDEMFASALDAVIYNRREVDRRVKNNKTIKILDCQAGVIVTLEYDLQLNCDIHIQLVGLRGNNNNNTAYLTSMTAKQTEDFVKDIGSPEWIRRHCDIKFAEAIPKAWSLSNEFYSILTQQLHMSHKPIIKVHKCKPTFDIMCTISFTLGGKLAEKLKVPSLKLFVDHLNEPAYYYSTPRPLEYSQVRQQKISNLLSVLNKSSLPHQDYAKLATVLASHQNWKKYNVTPMCIKRFSLVCPDSEDIVTEDVESTFTHQLYYYTVVDAETVHIHMKFDPENPKKLKIIVENFKAFDQAKSVRLHAFFTMFACDAFHTMVDGNLILERLFDTNIDVPGMYSVALERILNLSGWQQQQNPIDNNPRPMELGYETD